MTEVVGIVPRTETVPLGSYAANRGLGVLVTDGELRFTTPASEALVDGNMICYLSRCSRYSLLILNRCEHTAKIDHRALFWGLALRR